jgi:hypothetical protein
MDELKRLAKRLGQLRDALAEGEKNGAPERLLGLGRDAVFAWLRGEGPDEWIERLDVHPAQIEYLRGEGMWPWEEDLELDGQLAAADPQAAIRCWSGPEVAGVKALQRCHGRSNLRTCREYGFRKGCTVPGVGGSSETMLPVSRPLQPLCR